MTTFTLFLDRTDNVAEIAPKTNVTNKEYRYSEGTIFNIDVSAEGSRSSKLKVRRGANKNAISSNIIVLTRKAKNLPIVISYLLMGLLAKRSSVPSCSSFEMKLPQVIAANKTRGIPAIQIKDMIMKIPFIIWICIGSVMTLKLNTASLCDTFANMNTGIKLIIRKTRLLLMLKRSFSVFNITI